MADAFVETTILTDRLLKDHFDGRARIALKQYGATRLPVYAIKEFRAGPLNNYIYIHNKIRQHGFAGALVALGSLAVTPQRYKTATSLQGLAEAFSVLTAHQFKRAAAAHGDDFKAAASDLIRANLANLIRMAWRKRRSVTTSVSDELDGYPDVAPSIDKHGLFEAAGKECNVTDCCLGPVLRNNLDALEKLRVALVAQPDKPETVRRRKAIKQILKRPQDPISREMCRSLGDAVFAVLCPADHVVLTTNLKDHRPLCDAVGKRAVDPYDATR